MRTPAYTLCTADIVKASLQEPRTYAGGSIGEPNMEAMMNTLSFKGRWNEVAGKLKQQYANLTDDDLLFAEGKEDEMLGRLQVKLGKSKEEIRDLITKL
jgi:uncharacterized protein YjbJ (UPF0337 family)